MTEPLTDAAASEPVIVDFDLDDWIDGISPAQRAVTIYGRPDLFARYEILAPRIADLEKVVKDDEHAYSDEEELAALYAEREDLYHAQHASKTVWIVQALDDATTEAIWDECPVPDPLEEPARPVAPSDRAPAGAQAKHEAALTRYAAEHARWEKESAEHEKTRETAQRAQNLAFIAAAVVRIENADGVQVADGVSVAQLERLHAKPHGEAQLSQLLAAAVVAKSTEPVIPPFSSRTDSGSGPA